MNTDYTKMSLAELRSLATDIHQAAAVHKAALSEIETEVLRRHGDAMSAALSADGKSVGECSREIDGIKITFARKAKVKWDNDTLETIAASMPWATAKKVFKIEFSVPERIYKALTDDSLVNRLNEARTVEVAEPRITFDK